LFCSGTVNKIDVTDGFVEFLRFFLVSLKAEADDLKSVTADVYREGSEAVYAGDQFQLETAAFAK
jgi:hypothetical protein